MLETGLRVGILAGAASSMRSGLVVARLDADAAPLVYVNPGFVDMTGYTHTEVLGLDCRLLQGPGTDPQARARMAQAVRARRGISLQVLNYTKAGRPFWNDLTLNPIAPDAGPVRYYVGLLRDVTEQVEREAQLARSNLQLAAQAEELQQLNEALDAFASGVSHDLRGPLGVVASLADGIGQALQRGQAAHAGEMAALVGQQAARMSVYVQALLQACRANGQPLQVATVDISRLAGEVLDGLRAAEPDREVLATVQPGLQVDGDESLLRALLANLLSNAWKYTRGRAPARIEVVQAPGEPGVFHVRDNGSGFPAEQAAHLFQPFQRLQGHADIPGTGLGLSTARRIVQRHGGWIRAEARPDEGACFTFHIGRPRPALP